MLVGKLHDAVGERGRKQHRQPPFRLGAAPQQEAQILDEAEIEHPVGFVEDDDIGFAQIEDPLLEIVDEPSRRADENVGAVLQLLALLVVVDTAVREAEAETTVAVERLRVAVDLDRQLAGRRENERAGLVRPAPLARLAGDETIQRGDEKRRGLAGAGLRLPRHVDALQRRLQRLGLDGGAIFEACLGDALLDAFGQVEVAEFPIG